MRLGIFISKCGGAVSKAIDMEALTKEFERFACVRVFDNFYDTEDFNKLLYEVEKNDLDSIILAGDSPLVYKQTRNGEYLFNCLWEKGVNLNKIEVVNLMNMVVMPHESDPVDLQQKAILLIEVGIEKLKSSTDLEVVEISPRQAVAVIGATVGSIAVAQHLLDAGYKVYLIHKNSDIVFQKTQMTRLSPTLMYVMRHPRFRAHHNASVEDFYGYTGDYTLRISNGDTETELFIGAVVLSLEEYRELIKVAHSKFHVDIDAAGAMTSLDDETARSQTKDRGIFLTNPMRHDASDISQIFFAADAVAPLVINLLNSKEIYHQVKVSQVDEALCGGCGVCVKTCMFHAITLKDNPRVSDIDPRRCMGCGNCVTACPAEARDLLVSPTAYLFNSVEVLSKFKTNKNRPSILLLTCEGHGYESIDRAAKNGLTYPIEIMPLPVVCGGQIDMQLIMHAFIKGFDGVVMMICGEGCCHNIIGNVDLERRVHLFKEILSSRGLAQDRVHIISTCSRKGETSVDEINRFYNKFINEHRASDTIQMVN
ncbi:MAG: hydrogenase iron-sulfur subunit [bacterium]|nr:hydrogenase iron-sulfur subunit [bacterium]